MTGGHGPVIPWPVAVSGGHLHSDPVAADAAHGSGGYQALSGVSVVIPTHAGRLPFVARLLRSLSAAIERAGEPVEVIVVDDSPAPECLAVAELCEKSGASYLRGPRRGGAKRNRGVAAARYDLVWFIDSDCVAHHDAIRNHVKRMRAAPADVGALVGYCRFVGDGRWIWRVADRSGRYNSCFDWPLKYSEVLWGATANLAVRRDVLIAAGGFDENTWTVVGGEDGAACVAIVDSGFRIGTAPDAVVLHGRDHLTRLAGLVRSILRYGAADAYLCARFPSRRRPVATPPAFLLAGAVGGAALRLAGLRRGTGVGLAAGIGMLAARDLRSQRGRSRRVSELRSAWGYGAGYGEDIEVAATASVPTTAGQVDMSSATAESRATGLAYDLACVALDWAFDVGAAAAAVGRGRPDLVFRRFRYIDPRHFVPRGSRRTRSSIS